MVKIIITWVSLGVFFGFRGDAKSLSHESNSTLFSEDFLSFEPRDPCDCMKWIKDLLNAVTKDKSHRSNRHHQIHHTLTYACNAKSSDCSGIGDRIRGIQELLHIAAVTNRRFHIDWTFPTSLESYFLPSHEALNWTLPLRPSNKRSNETILRAANMRARDDYYKLVLSAAVDRHQQGVVVTSNMYFSEEPTLQELRAMDLAHVAPVTAERLVTWKNPFPATPLTGSGAPARACCEPRECLFHLLFRPSPLLLQATRKAIAELLPAQSQSRPTSGNVDPLSRPYLAVHLRLGGILGESRRVERVKTVSGPLSKLTDAELTGRTYNCSLALAARHGIADVVLVTDNVWLHERACKEYPGWLTQNIIPAHIQHAQKYFGASSPELRDNVMQTFVDLMVLAKSAVLVRSLSGFSDVAVQAGRHKNVYTIDECISTLDI
jgi:hypothetical protein